MAGHYYSTKGRLVDHYCQRHTEQCETSNLYVRLGSHWMVSVEKPPKPARCLFETCDTLLSQQCQQTFFTCFPLFDTMHMEIAQAVDFLGRLLQSKIEETSLNKMKQELIVELKARFSDHWDPQHPTRGNGYRSISNFNGMLDPVLVTGKSIRTLCIWVFKVYALMVCLFPCSCKTGIHFAGTSE